MIDNSYESMCLLGNIIKERKTYMIDNSYERMCLTAVRVSFPNVF